jgi:hypothetical protein
MNIGMGLLPECEMSFALQSSDGNRSRTRVRRGAASWLVPLRLQAGKPPACDVSHFTPRPVWTILDRIDAASRYCTRPAFVLSAVILRGEISMTTNPMYDREAIRWLLAEARAQRSRELRAAARELQDAVRWNGVALVCAACLTVVGVAACAV